METDAIKAALGTLGFTHDVSGAVAELKALEESHADMARALLAFVENAKTSDLRFTAGSELDDARAALRKAGVL